MYTSQCQSIHNSVKHFHIYKPKSIVFFDMDKAIHVNKSVFWFNPNTHINIYAMNVSIQCVHFLSQIHFSSWKVIAKWQSFTFITNSNAELARLPHSLHVWIGLFKSIKVSSKCMLNLGAQRSTILWNLDACT